MQGLLRRTCVLRKYHQEIFFPRQDFFLCQVMRGLKVEKRYEPGMGYGIFARDPLVRGELIMFDTPFLSLNLEETPKNVAQSLEEARLMEQAEEVLGRTCDELARLSKNDVGTARQWMQERNIDEDLLWMVLVNLWAKAWCNSPNPNLQVPMSYMSYVDSFREDDLEARVCVLGYNAMVKVLDLDTTAYDVDEFWTTLYKVKSNTFRGSLYPVVPTLVNHSCWPNARIEPDGALVALTDIPADSQIMVSLYGETCDEVKELAPPKFKCMTPGCLWSKRVPLPEPPQEKELPEYITPWHNAEYDLPQVFFEIAPGEEFVTPADAKRRKMYATERTRAGRHVGDRPSLPGSRPRRHTVYLPKEDPKAATSLHLGDGSEVVSKSDTSRWSFGKGKPPGTNLL